MRFVKVPESKDSFLHTICKRFPTDVKKQVSLSCQRHASGHTVTPFGFILLEKAETIMEGAKSTPKLKLVAYKGITVDEALLYHISLRVSRQKELIEEVEIHNASFGNEDTWLRMIHHSRTWNIQTIWLDLEPDEENGAYVIETLAEASGQGTIEKLIIRDKVLACGSISQLEKMWSITKVQWEVSCSHCEGETLIKKQEGWSAWMLIVILVKNIMAKKHEH